MDNIEVHGLEEGELQKVEIIKEQRKQCLNQILNVNESILKTKTPYPDFERPVLRVTLPNCSTGVKAKQ
jgi:hypothetical protein